MIGRRRRKRQEGTRRLEDALHMVWLATLDTGGNAPESEQSKRDAIEHRRVANTLKLVDWSGMPLSLLRAVNAALLAHYQEEK